jgi:hypothetical protein
VVVARLVVVGRALIRLSVRMEFLSITAGKGDIAASDNWETQYD